MCPRRAWRPGSESVAYSDSDLLGTIDVEIFEEAKAAGQLQHRPFFTQMGS